MIAKRKGIIIVFLVICELASLIILFERITVFSAAEVQNIIPLTESRDLTKVNAATKEELYSVNNSDSVNIANPSYTPHDEEKAWQSETEVEIFHLTYVNDVGEVTVNGKPGNKDKLFAPGTSNEYVFTLENSGNVPLDYSMNMEAYVTGTDLDIPVRVRVWDYKNDYLIGDSTHKEKIMELNNVYKEGVLGAGRYAVYTLEWEWPYEQGIDDYDTMLGNLAVDNDLTLTIKINTIAVYDEDPDNPEVKESGLINPKTGDTSSYGYYMIVAIFAMLIIFVSLFLGNKSKEKDTGDNK